MQWRDSGEQTKEIWLVSLVNPFAGRHLFWSFSLTLDKFLHRCNVLICFLLCRRKSSEGVETPEPREAHCLRPDVHDDHMCIKSWQLTVEKTKSIPIAPPNIPKHWNEVKKENVFCYDFVFVDFTCLSRQLSCCQLQIRRQTLWSLLLQAEKTKPKWASMITINEHVHCP